MANAADKMLRVEPFDEWSTREKLALATYVQKNNDQNFSSTKSLKAFAEPNRPDDWFSRKMCALQYRKMLDLYEKDLKQVPKRKRREKGTEETTPDLIVKKFTEMRMAELKESIPELIFEHYRLQAKLEKLRDPATREGMREEAKEFVRQHEKDVEEAEKKRQKWLEERDIKINNMAKQPVGAMRAHSHPQKVLVKQEAVDLDHKPSTSELPPPATSASVVEDSEKIPTENVEISEVKEVLEKAASTEDAPVPVGDEIKNETEETIVAPTVPQTPPPEEPKIPVKAPAEPEVVVPTKESLPADETDKQQSQSKSSKAQASSRPTRSSIVKPVIEPVEIVEVPESPASTEDSTVSESISEKNVAPPPKSEEPVTKADKFNKKSAMNIIRTLQNHRYSSLITSPLAIKVGKDVLIKKIEIVNLKKKIETDQISSNDELARCLTLIFLGALYANNIDWSSPDYSKVQQMQQEILDMIIDEKSASLTPGQRPKRAA